MPPRNYTLGERGAARAATREKILEATRLLLGGKGDLGEFSMEAVADKAGVSRMTVYNQFESRTGLLDALADHLAARGGMHQMREVFGAADLESAVRRFVQVFVGFWASDRVTLRRMRALGVLYPSLHGGLPGRDAWRREAADNLFAMFGGRTKTSSPALPPNAAELLAAITSFDTFDSLSVGSRTPDEVARLITETAFRVLGLSASPVPSRPRGRAGRRGARNPTPPPTDG
jgi:AcrR family transcriptional regulator